MANSVVHHRWWNDLVQCCLVLVDLVSLLRLEDSTHSISRCKHHQAQARVPAEISTHARTLAHTATVHDNNT